MILFTVALGVLIFVIARKLFGARAAVFAVALFSFEPTVLAHGRVVQTDMPAAFGYLLFLFVLYWYLQGTILAARGRARRRNRAGNTCQVFNVVAGADSLGYAGGTFVAAPRNNRTARCF